MNPQSLTEAKQLFNSVKRGLRGVKNAVAVICPPFIYLPIFSGQTSEKFSLCAENCFFEEIGAFTGEISATMLKNLGVEYVILGHSERRKYLGETDEMINKKIKAAISKGLKVILCVGEDFKIRQRGKKAVEKFVKNQLQKDLKGIVNLKLEIKNLAIAYEPVWAIGTGRACESKEAKEVNFFIKKSLNNKNIPILYGGSVNSKNASDYIKISGFQGLLVGGASLVAEEFIKIVKFINRT